MAKIIINGVEINPPAADCYLYLIAALNLQPGDAAQFDLDGSDVVIVMPDLMVQQP